ncbi:DNA repair protein XRCC3 homolog [Chenopodium quinoa]|uniref:DNA repair protein XRCC3 homolog n=1 Tax=Chenopodium quinoa TaxID=63459 RepID=UPI000B799169|nr:DNA repair protein XRCC3 homolog [Chenopodium quinoa]
MDKFQKQNLWEETKEPTEYMVFKSKMLTENGLDEMEQLKLHYNDMNQKCKTGCPTIDSLLMGGIPTGVVIEIYGESGSGKTQLCLQLCLVCQKMPRYGGLFGSVVYIQAVNPFLVKRLTQIAELVQGSLGQVDNPMENIFVKQITDVDELYLALPQLEE